MGRTPSEDRADLDKDRDSDAAPAADDEREHLDQPEDEATEHALRLMNEALRQSDAGRRWLVSENP